MRDRLGYSEPVHPGPSSPRCSLGFNVLLPSLWHKKSSTMSGQAPDIEGQAEQKRAEPRDSDSDSRSKSVTDTTNPGGDDESPRSSRLLLVEVADSDTQGEGRQELPPLGVKLTGYRLLNISVILAFGIAKVVTVFAYCGRTVIPTTPEWVAGTFIAVMWVFHLVMGKTMSC
jgi:hypothetical protein